MDGCDKGGFRISGSTFFCIRRKEETAERAAPSFLTPPACACSTGFAKVRPDTADTAESRTPPGTGDRFIIMRNRGNYKRPLG